MSASAPDQIPRSCLPRRRVLVVNCYFDYSREPIRRTTKIPQAVGPIYLAGAFATELCEVRCYNCRAARSKTSRSSAGPTCWS
jgi:hypothetical protein